MPSTLGDRDLGRELVRDGPARRARDEAEPLLQREVVDLVDDAVDVVAERGALLARSARYCASISSTLVQRRMQRIGLEAVCARASRSCRAGSSAGSRATLAPGIGEEVAAGASASSSASSWRSEPAAALRGLANRRLAGRDLALVDGGEIGMGQVDLAAHLEDRRHVLALSVAGCRRPCGHWASRPRPPGRRRASRPRRACPARSAG